MNFANWRGEISVDRFFVDLEGLEDCLVQDPTARWLRLHVGSVNAVGELKDGFQATHNRFVIDRELFAPSLDGDSLTPESPLLLIE